jgi:DNA-binding transcriptional LysR family regulator
VTVLTAPLLAVMGEDHALAKRSLVRLTELAREKLLVVGGGKPSLHGNYLKALLEGRGLKAQHLVEVHGFESLLAMIAGGQGVSILAGRGSIVRVDNVVVRPLKETGPDLELEICAVWREWEPDPDLNPEL